MQRFLFYIWFVFFIVVTPSQVFAWGERGHDVITRVAVLHLADETNSLPELNRPFSQSADKLSHISNVPDIVWRADYMSEANRQLNAPTHYMDLDLLYTPPVELDDVKTNLSANLSLAEEKGLDLGSEVGTAPWRAMQFQTLLTESLRAAGNAENRDELVTHVNDAILYAGLMSHFVGDLANPHHTTIDHDGRMTGNGGLHAYFESAVLGVLMLDLDDQVLEQARQKLLLASLNQAYEPSELQDILSNPEKLVFALVVDSNRKLKDLVALDDTYSLVERGEGEDRATRKPPLEVAKYYESFIVERLAMAASVLSQLWLLAWEEAGKPDLSSYQSYVYPVRPDFIPPSYLSDNPSD